MPKVLSIDAEKKYQTLFDSAPDLMLMINKSGKILVVNKQVEKTIGYPAKDLLKKHMSLIIKEAYLAVFDALLKKCFKGTAPTTEIEILNKQGKPIWMDLDIAPIKDHGRDARVLVHLRDATEKEALLQQLIQSERLKALGKMTSGVAHNINNLLTIVLGHIRLLQSRPKDKQVLQDAINIISKCAWDGAQLINKLQTFSSKNKCHREKFIPVDINYIIRESIEFVKPRWKHEAQFHDIRYDIKYNNLTDVVLVSGNPGEFREVFVNIINNALDAMPEGGKLSFSTKTNGSKAIISVADSGIGIPEELCEEVFNPFFTTKYGKGIGLGLSTAYAIIARHRGSISVKSILGKGSVFTIKLPIVTAAGREEKFDTAPGDAIRAATVLIIDDEEEICRIVAKILTGAGHRVFTALNGKDGIEIFKNNRIDLFFVDLTMPDMSGWEVARTINNLESKKKHKTPMVIFTGWGDTLEPSKLAKTGVSMVVSKPLDNNQLLNIVKQTVQFRAGEGNTHPQSYNENKLESKPYART
ncbi:MAG: hybrid sensor histidine kinase/response regulator [Candidatus Brocadiales bacterium]